MGIDKDSVDIWKFGRKRPDLTLDESLAASEPAITESEAAERKALLATHFDDFARTKGPEVIAMAKVAKAKGTA